MFSPYILFNLIRCEFYVDSIHFEYFHKESNIIRVRFALVYACCKTKSIREQAQQSPILIRSNYYYYYRIIIFFLLLKLPSLHIIFVFVFVHSAPIITKKTSKKRKIQTMEYLVKWCKEN